MNNLQEDNVKSVFHIEDLKFGSCEGVLEVVSFSPSEIQLRISLGGIEICGGNLEIKSFDVEKHCLSFIGDVTSISLKQIKQSFFKRLTK